MYCANCDQAATKRFKVWGLISSGGSASKPEIRKMYGKQVQIEFFVCDDCTLENFSAKLDDEK